MLDWEWARRLWEGKGFLVLVIVGCIAYLGYGFATRSGTPANEATTPTAAKAPADTLSQDELKRILNEERDRTAAPPPPTEAEIAQADIDAYQAQFDADTAAPDAPAYLFASANLYANKLGNDEQACRLYERLLLEYPEWERINSVYPLLCAAYERAGERQARLDLLYTMQKKFPEDSPLYLYATEQLGRMPAVNPHPEAEAAQ